MDMASLEGAAMDEILRRGPKSLAYYRMQVTRKLTGRRNLAKFKAHHDVLLAELQSAESDKLGNNKETGVLAVGRFNTPGAEQTRLFFNPGHYTVLESVGYVAVNVTREGGDMGLTVVVDYQTEDGTASAGRDYEFARYGAVTVGAHKFGHSSQVSPETANVPANMPGSKDTIRGKDEQPRLYFPCVCVISGPRP
jgi:solute carrier family 8 (sodium/calcium exchanger)